MSRTITKQKQDKRAMVRAQWAQGAQDSIIVGTLENMARGMDAIRAARRARERERQGV